MAKRAFPIMARLRRKLAIPLELGSDSAILLKTRPSITKPIMKVPNEKVTIAYTIFTRAYTIFTRG